MNLTEDQINAAILYDKAISFVLLGSLCSNASVDETMRLLENAAKFVIQDSPEKEFLEECVKYLRRITSE